MKNSKYFVFFSIFIFAMSILPLILIIFFINTTYENNSIDEIVKKQISDNVIFNSKFIGGNKFLYKLTLIKEKKPKIISLGSSRVMQFREKMLKTSFVNAGGGMNYLNEGLMFLNEMTKTHIPKYIVLGLDFWWFNPNFSQPKNFSRHEIIGNGNIKQKVLTIANLLKDGKIKFNTFYNGLLSLENKVTSFENIGINAIDYSNGFRKDGSYFYSHFIFGEKENHDIKFSDTFERINKGNKRFEYSQHLSEERIKILKSIVEFCKKNDIELIIFIPPLPQETRDSMSSLVDKYNFIYEFRKMVRNLDIEAYDYHDMKDIKNDSCEFIDGFHGGDVVYQRILKDMHNKNSILKKYINIELINLSIKKNEGKVLSIFDESKYKLSKEVDFLKIGCKK